MSKPPTTGMDDWLGAAADRLAAAAGVPRPELELDAADIALLLEAAGAAAHESGRRTNAPLLCFLLGVCAGRGADLDGLRNAVRE